MAAAAAAAAKSRHSFLTLCDPINGSLPGSPIPGGQEGKRVNLTFGGQQLLGFGFKLQMKSSTARSPPPTSAPCLAHQSSSTRPLISVTLGPCWPTCLHLSTFQYLESVLCFFWVCISSSIKRNSINNSHSLQN